MNKDHRDYLQEIQEIENDLISILSFALDTLKFLPDSLGKLDVEGEGGTSKSLDVQAEGKGGTSKSLDVQAGGKSKSLDVQAEGEGNSDSQKQSNQGFNSAKFEESSLLIFSKFQSILIKYVDIVNSTRTRISPKTITNQLFPYSLSCTKQELELNLQIHLINLLLQRI